MKVNIGKYPRHRWYHNFVFWHFGYEAKVKEKIVIEEFDTWSMDHTLAKIILPMLIQLKETKHGAPFVEMEDVPELLRWDMKDERHYNTKGEVDEQYFERWEYVISEMIWAFEQKNSDDWTEQYTKGEHDIQWIELEDGMSEMTKGPNDTFESDDEGVEAHQKRITNGFRLFGKYYEGLWD
tara:strand:- start:3045 stop:3587 length:543 start_codon:yes stop_codon:yes gene_type:complete